MRLYFEPRAFETPTNRAFLRKILELVDDGRHEWYVVDPDIIEQTPWFKGLGDSFRLLLEKAARTTAYYDSYDGKTTTRKIHRTLFTVGHNDYPAGLAPANAYDYLKSPLKILVEDGKTDGAFVKAVLAIFAQPETLQLYRDKGLECDGPGGSGNLKNRVEMRYGDSKNNPGELRMIVVTDSDRTMPKKEISREARLLKDLCEKHGIPFHMLQKRAIENYIPDEVVREWGEDPQRTRIRRQVEALRRMSGEARDYFPVKENKFKKFASSDETQWYKNALSEEDFVALSDKDFHGFGVHFIDILFVDNGNEAKKPCGSLTAEALRRRDGQGELEKLVQLIERWL